MDVGFPVIEYAARAGPLERGRQHGEQFREAIAELAALRRHLMAEKNPRLGVERVAALAAAQWQMTCEYSAELGVELDGICQGARVTPADLVVLNNYTDFRDIPFSDQGCSTVYVHRGQPLAGQTWDMHGSAKRFVCCLRVLAADPRDEQILFSVVGCLGMMGYSARGLAVGVNNLNTHGARPGVLWPAVVRQLLAERTVESMARRLIESPVTSGHAYLLSSGILAELWEVMPGLVERVGTLRSPSRGHLFHTNHCIGVRAAARELPAATASTTRIRWDLLEKKAPHVRTMEDLVALLTDHENYPRSICSNFQSGSQDPSITCGGAAGCLSDGRVRLWRGDPVYDAHFVERQFQLGAVDVG